MTAMKSMNPKKERIMKKMYIKPSKRVFEITPSRLLADSDETPYGGRLGYNPIDGDSQTA